MRHEAGLAVAVSASQQFARKISGFNKPSQANEAAFAVAVDEVAALRIASSARRIGIRLCTSTFW